MDIPFHTKEDGMEKLKIMVQARENSKYCIWYDIWQKDCQEFAKKLIAVGSDPQEISAILEWKSNKIW